MPHLRTERIRTSFARHLTRRKARDESRFRRRAPDDTFARERPHQLLQTRQQLVGRLCKRPTANPFAVGTPQWKEDNHQSTKYGPQRDCPKDLRTERITSSYVALPTQHTEQPPELMSSYVTLPTQHTEQSPPKNNVIVYCVANATKTKSKKQKLKF